MKKMYTYTKRRPGISLLFAMTIVTVGFVIMIGSIELATSTLQNTRATSYRLDAYYGALSGLEQAGWIVAEQAEDDITGYASTGGSLDDYETWEGPLELDTDGDGVIDPGDSTTYYYIVGQSGVMNAGTELYNPLPGTGTAGGADCSIFNPPTDEDDPCMWNRLEIGDIATIPLYYSDDGTSIENPADNTGAWNTLELYIRVPCEWDEASGSCTGAGAQNDSGKIVVNWEIIADCDLGEGSCYLIPYEKSLIDSHIYESNIDNTQTVLESSNSDKSLDQTGDDGNLKKIIDFITQSTSSGDSVTIENPVLRFSITDIVDLTDGNTAPYLEYQLRTTDTDAKTGNAYIILAAKGFGGPTSNFEQTLTRALGRSTNIIQFVLSN